MNVSVTYSGGPRRTEYTLITGYKINEAKTWKKISQKLNQDYEYARASGETPVIGVDLILISMMRSSGSSQKSLGARR